MTELQMGLIGVGSLAVVVVFAYNKWQERKQRKAAEAVLRTRYADVLLADEPPAEGADEVPAERSEPVLREAEMATAAAVAPAAMPMPPAAPEIDATMPAPAAIPVVEVRSADAVLPVVDFPAPPPPHLLSPLADCIVTLDAVEPMPAEQFLHSQRATMARLGKRVRWLGFDEAAREWRQVEAGSRGAYRRLRVGLQLADRRGPVGEADFADFNAAMQQLSEEFMAVAELPQRATVVEAAKALDNFCADVDIQIGLNVVAQGQPFPGTKIRALAEAAGMSLAADGTFVRRDDDGNALFSLASHAPGGFTAETIRTLATPGLTFLLDVPRVTAGDRVFGQMLDLARRCADALHGVLVDDNRRPLSEPQLEPIRRQITQVQAAMGGRGIPAGGHLALRLFS